MALYMNGQEISQSSGVPIAVGGLTEIDSTTPTSLNGILKGNGSTVQAATAGTDYMTPPVSVTTLPDSGTALTANTIYAVTAAVGTYAFKPPRAGGWAHGYFATGASVDISLSGNFLGAAPIVAASKACEFDVCESIWAVQEIVSA